MKTKLVLWGANAQDERILIAMELLNEANKVNIWTFPDPLVSEEFSQAMLQKWRNGEQVDFPEGATHYERELTISDTLLPDDVKTDRTDLVQRAQSEWHFIVLSSRLNESYRAELESLEDKVKAMSAYSADMWNTLKEFWDKVQSQVRERNLFREHADTLRDKINALFARLKELRSDMDNAFVSQSKAVHDKFMAELDTIEQRAATGGRLASLFDELKLAQRNFREAKLSRDHSNAVWQRLDGLFKTLKEKRFGQSFVPEATAGERLDRRLEGLMSAVNRMQQSIDRDREELDFQRDKIAASEGQLEAQIRQAKIQMIESRIASKDEKLQEMLQTKTDLEGKMLSQKERDRRREERDKADAAKEAAKKVVKEKIAEEVQQNKKKFEDAAHHVTPEKPAEETTASEEVATPVEAPVTAAAEEVVAEEVATPVAPAEVEIEVPEEMPATEETPEVEAPAEATADVSLPEEMPVTETVEEAGDIPSEDIPPVADEYSKDSTEFEK